MSSTYIAVGYITCSVKGVLHIIVIIFSELDLLGFDSLFTLFYAMWRCVSSYQVSGIYVAGLPQGFYCDMVTSDQITSPCSTGRTVEVDSNGRVHVEILANDPTGVISIFAQP